MSQSAVVSSGLKRRGLRPVPTDLDIGDDSPFGLQALARQTITILKPECINQLAMSLALRGSPAEIRSPEFVQKLLSRNQEWVDEYQVVHLVEKSLWIQGQSDLVMTLIRNPAQIPDNPPARVTDALTRANAMHPDATIWYGVPLFSDRSNADGLPIPLTAEEVKNESERRIVAAQKHALRWRWVHRAILAGICLPGRINAFGDRMVAGAKEFGRRIAEHSRNVKADFQRRRKAMAHAELELCRCGSAQTRIPGHSTWLGRGLETTAIFLESLEIYARNVGKLSPLVGALAGPLAVAKFLPLMIVPISVVSCDPFLFVELKGEPGKLRHIGHWYWQTKQDGDTQLHLHV